MHAFFNFLSLRLIYSIDDYVNKRDGESFFCSGDACRPTPAHYILAAHACTYGLVSTAVDLGGKVIQGQVNMWLSACSARLRPRWIELTREEKRGGVGFAAERMDRNTKIQGLGKESRIRS